MNKRPVPLAKKAEKGESVRTDQTSRRLDCHGARSECSQGARFSLHHKAGFVLKAEKEEGEEDEKEGWVE